MSHHAPEPCLISPEELAYFLGREPAGLKIVDGSYTLPGVSPRAAEVFQSKRIPGAVFFDIDAISDRTTDLPHMLPGPDAFAEAVGGLGISPRDLVVIYGQESLAMGPARVWWTFRMFGHGGGHPGRVRVLNGSLRDWEARGYSVETSAPSVPVPASYACAAPLASVVSAPDVLGASRSESTLILDARPQPRFDGTAPEPRPGLRCGHIPGSQCLPAGSLVDPATGGFLPEGALRQAFSARGMAEGRPMIASCGSGVTACVLALAQASLGNPDVKVYDGSWAEWGQTSSALPLEISAS